MSRKKWGWASAHPTLTSLPIFPIIQQRIIEILKIDPKGGEKILIEKFREEQGIAEGGEKRESRRENYGNEF